MGRVELASERCSSCDLWDDSERASVTVDLNISETNGFWHEWVLFKLPEDFFLILLFIYLPSDAPMVAESHLFSAQLPSTLRIWDSFMCTLQILCLLLNPVGALSTAPRTWQQAQISLTSWRPGSQNDSAFCSVFLVLLLLASVYLSN